jgi:hypothetical protein
MTAVFSSSNDNDEKGTHKNVKSYMSKRQRNHTRNSLDEALLSNADDEDGNELLDPVSSKSSSLGLSCPFALKRS